MSKHHRESAEAKLTATESEPSTQPDAQVTAEEPNTQPDVQPTVLRKPERDEKLVSITPRETLRFAMGKRNWYAITKGVEMKVPESVAAHLRERGLI